MYVCMSDHNQAGTDMRQVHHDCCNGSCQNVHGSSMSMPPLIFPHCADTQVLADADADVKGLTLSANGGTGAHQGAEGARVGVGACGDRGLQSCHIVRISPGAACKLAALLHRHLCASIVGLLQHFEQNLTHQQITA